MFTCLDYSRGYKYFPPGSGLLVDKMKKQTRKAKTGAPFPMHFSIAWLDRYLSK